MNKKLINTCNKVMNDLRKFSNEILYLGPKIEDDRLEVFERKVQNTLPEDFKYMLKKANGFSLMGTEVYGLDDALLGSSLEKIYDFEHYTANNKMFKELLPFSPDGRGNHYCLDLSRVQAEICPVVFWQWDLKYNSIHEVEVVNSSFFDFVQEVLINWTLEEYDYEGKENS